MNDGDIREFNITINHSPSLLPRYQFIFRSSTYLKARIRNPVTVPKKKGKKKERKIEPRTIKKRHALYNAAAFIVPRISQKKKGKGKKEGILR